LLPHSTAPSQFFFFSVLEHLFSHAFSSFFACPSVTFFFSVSFPPRQDEGSEPLRSFLPPEMHPHPFGFADFLSLFFLTEMPAVPGFPSFCDPLFRDPACRRLFCSPMMALQPPGLPPSKGAHLVSPLRSTSGARVFL